MAVVIRSRPFSWTPQGAFVVHTDLRAYTSPAPRLETRVRELTRFTHTTFLLVGLLVIVWVVLKVITHQRFGAFYFGWFEIVAGVVTVLVVGAEFSARNHRRCLGGELVPARVFITEGKSILDLTIRDGEHRMANGRRRTPLTLARVATTRITLRTIDVPQGHS